MIVLIFNAGSSTLKWSALDSRTEAIEAEGTEPWAEAGEPAQLEAILERAPAAGAIGHRIVHGGSRFQSAVIIGPEVRAALAELVPIDPLHAPASLAAIDAIRKARPGIVQVAAFDTAFHRTLPDAASHYAVPLEWVERFGVRRYGFHGLSVAYAVERSRAIFGRLPRRLVVCHLGSGSSVTAIEDGRSTDTSMGFTPLEGVTMATRSGTVDPGALLYLVREGHLTLAELDDALVRRAGLFGLSGEKSGDLRLVLAAADQGSARARLAYAQLLHSLRRAIGGMIAVLGGIDALVFTGGIGEHSARVRRDVAGGFAFLGLSLDEDANQANPIDRDIAASGSAVRMLVIRAREDLMVLAEMKKLGCVVA